MRGNGHLLADVVFIGDDINDIRLLRGWLLCPLRLILQFISKRGSLCHLLTVALVPLGEFAEKILVNNAWKRPYVVSCSFYRTRAEIIIVIPNPALFHALHNRLLKRCFELMGGICGFFFSCCLSFPGCM